MIRSTIRSVARRLLSDDGAISCLAEDVARLDGEIGGYTHGRVARAQRFADVCQRLDSLEATIARLVDRAEVEDPPPAGSDRAE